MSAQLELPLAKAGPEISEEDISALMKALDEAGGWMKAREFPAPWNERRLRAVANASGGRVISGQRGYKLTRLATIEEVQHAAAWLRHQAHEMQRRAMEIDRIYHGKVRPEMPLNDEDMQRHGSGASPATEAPR